MKHLQFLIPISFIYSCSQEPVDLRSSDSVSSSQSSADAKTSEDKGEETAKTEPKEILEISAQTEKIELPQNYSSEASVSISFKDTGSATFRFEEHPTLKGEFKVGESKITANHELNFNASEFELNIIVTHKPASMDGGVLFSLATPQEPLTLIIESDMFESKKHNINVTLLDVAIVSVEDPGSNGGMLVAEKKLTLDQGVGLCLLNNYKDGLQLHGVPHQNADGMKIGECYDKYSGMTKSLADIKSTTPCSADSQRSDTMYDHSAGNIGSQGFTVECSEK